MLVMERKYKWHKKIKGVNTTIHMGISHQAFSLHCILIPTHVLVFDQFKLLLQWSSWYWDSLWSSFLAGSACYSPGQQKIDVQVVIWSRWVSLENSASLIFMLIVVYLGLEWKWFSLFWDPKPLPFTTSGSPFISTHLVPHVLPHLPPHFFSPYLQNSSLGSWWVGCNMLMIFLSVYFVECCLTWAGKKGATSWFELLDLH